MKTVFCEQDHFKIVFLDQAVVQAPRPKTFLAPLQIGLAIQVHHHFASRFLIDALHCHGFSSSYKEVKKFELSAAQCHGTDIPGVTENHSLQFYVAGP